MIPQKQRVVDKGKGDCFRACMASFLELPNDERLPDGYKSVEPWNAWLARFGMVLNWSDSAIWRTTHWIASVKSKNYDGITHAIVMKGTKVAFDPSTKKRYRKGLDMIDGDAVVGGWWIEVIDPSLLYKFQQYKESL